MRRDSIFYQLFQRSPTLLFELLDTPPPNASNYRFDAVAVKEPKFEIDGVFLPPETETPGVVYFCEVQFQRDEILYERLFSESFLYFYRNRDRFSNWQTVVIYPNRRTEQTETSPYNVLLESNQVHRVYLDELGDWQQLPLGVALMVLTTIEEDLAATRARELLERSRQQPLPPDTSRYIMEMITTILVYKFTNLNRREVEVMMGVRLQETRFYQDVKQEGREEGLEEGREEGLREAVERQRSLILLQLERKIGAVGEQSRDRLSELDLTQLEALALALLDFTESADLEAWLTQQQA